MYIVQKRDLYGNWVDVYAAQKQKSAERYLQGMRGEVGGRIIIKKK